MTAIRSPATRVPLALLRPVNAMLVEQMLARWPRVEVAIAEDGESGLERARATLSLT